MANNTGYTGQGVHNGVHYNAVPVATAQVCVDPTKPSAVGGVGDYLYGVEVFPGTTSPSSVTISDGATVIATFAGGATSVASLVPFFILIDAKSINGAWKVTTGASNVTAVATGEFS